MSSAPRYGPLPPDPPALACWIAARLHEPSREWRPTSPLARGLPQPVDLPGMGRAMAALLARYHFMVPEWHADVVQDFMGHWLLRPQTPHTIARSALSGVDRGQAASLEAAIAWKLRAELLSQAHRAYVRARRNEERRRALERLAADFEPLAREATCREREAECVPMVG